jgi:hypothetical protein
MKTIDVTVQKDHLEKLATTRKPTLAIAELIWNALDADATDVRVDFVDNGIGGTKQITVTDNGPKGMAYDRALQSFGDLGGSWKKTAVKTDAEGRLLHGKAGIGRFKAFALGNHVTWSSVFRKPDQTLAAFTITGRRDHLKRFKVSDPKSATGPAGTMVTIEDVPIPHDTLHDRRLLQDVTEQFALYLTQYPHVFLRYSGWKVDPSKVIDRREKCDVTAALRDGRALRAELEIIEWHTNASRALVLCDSNGFALAERAPNIQAPGFNFTAYLRSDYLRELHEKNLLDLDELHADVRPLIEAAKAKLRSYFRKRAAERAEGAVSNWKREEIYPYAGDPKSPVEDAERQVFDIVALNVAQYLPDFDKSDAKQKKLAFLLLKQALEDSPDAVQTIIGDVLNLPIEKQEELADLLKTTTLSAIISASKVIADRLNFIKGLEIILFDDEPRKRTLERYQLHRILVQNTWLFGEEFNLTVDDDTLDEVLAKHLDQLPERVGSEIEGPVLRDDGSGGEVDLMLSRRVPMPRPEERHHLVIELKRPSKKLDLTVANQIESYAMAVAADPRFDDANTSWTFWAVASEVTEQARKKARQADRPDGLLYQSEDRRIRVWVRTWAQIIEGAKGRLEFFRKELNYSADRVSARKHLNAMYKKYLPDVLKDREGDAPAVEGEGEEPAGDTPA